MEFIDLQAHYQASRELIQRRVQAVLDHGQYVMGPEVGELEARLAAYAGARHCITVASGNEALAVALMALEVGPGDEVITTPFAFNGTFDAIVQAGATPVFADIDRATCTLDAGLVEEKVTPRTRAILPVSLYGQPADMDALNAIARRHELAVVEDGAQSFGATFRERKSGNLSTIGCTSFSPSRPLGCYSDGGALFTSDEALAGRMRQIRRLREGARGQGPMDTLQCAVVLAKLERFEWELEQRRRAAASYDALFSGRLQLIARPRDRSSAHAQYTVVVDERERVQLALRAAGIPATLHNPLPEQGQPACSHLAAADGCPVALGLAEKVMCLPMGPYIDDVGARHVGEALLRAIGVPIPALAERARPAEPLWTLP
jgi:UDP-2-acetamido-2-deoxy-ribo-hexuluronate aminotransferase